MSLQAHTMSATHRRAALPVVLLLAFALHAQDVTGTEPNRGGDLDLRAQDPAYAQSQLVPAPGFEVELFASEQDFPLLANPVAITFDDAGRLWVSTMPGYPQWRPGDLDGQGRPGMDDRLLVLSDDDGDGHADSCRVFADSLQLPTGFELGHGGVYVAQQPDLLFLRDTDGDGAADQRETILHGFGTEDSHHGMAAFTWGPGGALYFQEGTFKHTQVETPWGPVRCVDAGVYRFEPTTWKLSVFVSYRFANPWGDVFDRWGQSFIADASGGSNYWATAFSGHIDYPKKHGPVRELTTTRVRPTAGAELVSSRQFPEDWQGDLLINNNIGFQGVARFRMRDDGAGFVGVQGDPLLYSKDIEFRPVALQFGPDGALYVCDWFNPLIGHMQYSLRDPRRDHAHGRIWRIRAKDRPLLTPPKIAGASIEELLALLKAPEDRTRYRARRALRDRDPAAVGAALTKWIAALDRDDADYEHDLLEALWMRQGLDVVDVDLLDRVLGAKDFHARAAATRVLQCQWQRVPGALERLRHLTGDPAARVRLEAVRACSFVPDARAAEVALEVVRQPMDSWLDYVLDETLATLEPYWRAAMREGRPLCADNPDGLRRLLSGIGVDELLALPRSEPVLDALLHRPGVPAAERVRALRDRAAARHDTLAAELLELLSSSDDGATAELAKLLDDQPIAELAPSRDALVELARHGRASSARTAAFVALLQMQPADALWKLAEDASVLGDLLRAVPRAKQSPVALRERLRALLDPATALPPVRGRYVRVSLSGPATLTLAEVEVFTADDNVAEGKPARQSATAWGGDPGRAVDGDTDGRYEAGSSTHTPEDAPDPWWEVDLGQEYDLEEVVVWNRTDAEFFHRLDGYVVTVLDEDRRTVLASAPRPASREAQSTDLQALARQQLQSAALLALAALPGDDAGTFATLSAALREPDLRVAAANAMLQRDASTWPAKDAVALADALVPLAAEVPFEARSEPRFVSLVALGDHLRAALPPARAAALHSELHDLDLLVVDIGTVPAMMRYDTTTFRVPAGKPVEVRFENADVMPHNLLIVTPGALEKVGTAAEAMATQPDALARSYTPELPEVLFGTGLIDPGRNAVLHFVAPAKPGDYPFLCTYPGHWRTMNGIMQVVPAGD